MESAEAFAGVRPHAFTILTRWITLRNAPLLRIHYVSRVARALSGSFARTMTTFRRTNRNTHSHMVSIAFAAAAHIRGCAATVGASYADRFACSVQILPVSFAADRLLAPLKVQPTTVIIVITCVDVVCERKDAIIVTVVDAFY